MKTVLKAFLVPGTRTDPLNSVILSKVDVMLFIPFLSLLLDYRKFLTVSVLIRLLFFLCVFVLFLFLFFYLPFNVTIDHP